MPNICMKSEYIQGLPCIEIKNRNSRAVVPLKQPTQQV